MLYIISVFKNLFLRLGLWPILKNIPYVLEKNVYSVVFYMCIVHMEKVMAPHSITLAWKIPWMEEPGRLQSMGSRRVGHD